MWAQVRSYNIMLSWALMLRVGGLLLAYWAVTVILHLVPAYIR